METVIYLLPALMMVALFVLVYCEYPVGFIIGGLAVVFGGIGFLFGVFALSEFNNIVYRIWGGAADSHILVAVPMFLFMGAILDRSGVAVDLMRCLHILLRRLPGSLALTTLLMGTILATTTGIIGASVVMLTLLALPVMKKQGYDLGLAGGTVAAAGCLGILIPPSIMLVFMGFMMQVSVGKLFLAAVVPGLLLAALYAVYIVVAAILDPRRAPPLADEDIVGGRELAVLLARGFIPPVVLIILVLGSIFQGWATPTEAAGIGAAGAMLLAAFNRQLTTRVVNEALRSSLLINAMVFMITIASAGYSYVLRSLGGDDLVISFLQALGAGPWEVLIMVMIVVFLLGFPFDWIEISLIVLPILVPILAKLDFSAHVGTRTDVSIWFIMLMAVNMQTSFLTPPVGNALFYMKGAAGNALRMDELNRGIIPFILLQLLLLMLCMVFPEIVLWLPRQMTN